MQTLKLVGVAALFAGFILVYCLIAINTIPINS